MLVAAWPHKDTSVRPTLSICLITKNEEAHLRRCLESVRGLWDDLVVVDTGSTDRTVEIARSCGARVFNFVWQDDFSRARNFCLEQATGDWILSLDADESIASRDHAIIRAQMASDGCDAVFAVQRHYLARTVVGWKSGSGGYAEGEPYSGYLDTDCRRLFRNRPWLRFVNRVHEVLVSIDPARPVTDIRGGWVIHHYGKVGAAEVLTAKGEHYLRILLRKVEEHPADPQAYHELGIQYSELQRFNEALAAFERLMTIAPGYADTYLQMAICYIGLKQPARALVALRDADRTRPDLAGEIALAEGNLHRDEGDFAAAEIAFRRGIARNPGFAAVSLNLALLYERQHREADTIRCLEAALKHHPTHVELLAVRARLRRAAGDIDGALADLERAGPNSAPLRPRARILAGAGRFDEARACVSRIAEAADADLASLLGAIALGSGQPDEAIGHLRESLRLTGTHEAALNLSIVLESRGDHLGALTAAAEALRWSPDEPVAMMRVARLAGQSFKTPAGDTSGALTIYFFLPKSMPFDGRTPRERGLGGTESAVVYLAEALVQRGHRVAVFNGCDTPLHHGGVEYASWETYPVRCISDRPDVVVGVRHWETMGRLRLAPLQMFWSLDAYDQAPLMQLGDTAARAEIDRLVVGSRWQAETFETHHGVPEWQLVQANNGSAASAGITGHRGDSVPRAAARPRRLAYASTPFRGLDVLLRVFPRIRAACPDAELEIFSSMQVYGWSTARDDAEFRSLYRQADQPGVTLVGSLPQGELAARLRQVRILAYPNHYAETFCIAAIEAQAAGCVVVTSQLGALPETVGDGGLCIPGNAYSASYQDAFVDACVSLLTDDARWQSLSDEAISRTSRDYTWPAVAAEWERFSRAELVAEPPIVGRVAVHLAAGRAALAQKMLQRESVPEAVSTDAWDALRAFTAWSAGAGQVPDEDALRLVGSHFRSLRPIVRPMPAVVA